MTTASERVEAVLEHITYTKGVLGALICTRDGTPIRDTFQGLDRSVASAYADAASELVRQAVPLFVAPKPAEEPVDKRRKSVAKAHALPIEESSLEVLRVRTKMYEMIVQCHDDFLIVVVQEPVD